MHRRNLLRVAKRLDEIERALTLPTASERVVAILTDVAATGALGPVFAAAWDEYARVRADLEARRDPTPDGYRPHLPRRVRRFLWRALDHPALSRPVDTMLGLYVEAQDAAERAANDHCEAGDEPDEAGDEV